MEHVTSVTAYHADPLAWVANLCNMLGLKPGEDTAINIRTAYRPTYGDTRREDIVELELKWKLLNASARRAVKRFCKLEVPQWAMGGTYKEPPMYGTVELRAGADSLTIQLQVDGAYVCEQVGEQEQDPSQYDKAQQATLAAMTPEEVMAEHAERVAELGATKKKPSYRCRPA